MGFFRRRKKPTKAEEEAKQQQQQEASATTGQQQRMTIVGVTSEPASTFQQQPSSAHQQHQQQQKQEQQQQQQQPTPSSPRRLQKLAPSISTSTSQLQPQSQYAKSPPPNTSVTTSSTNGVYSPIRKTAPPQLQEITSPHTPGGTSLKDPPPALKSPPPQAVTTAAAAAAAAYVPPALVVTGPNTSSGSKPPSTTMVPVATKSPPPGSSHPQQQLQLAELSLSPPSVTNIIVGDPALATPDVTRDLIKRFISDIWNRGALDMIPQVCSPSLRFNGNVGMDRVGHDGFAHMVTTIRNALSDYHCEVHSMVVEANKAFCRLRFTGRHTGELLGFAPTGKLVAWMGAAEFTCKNGRIMKVWELGDVKSLEEQLQGYE